MNDIILLNKIYEEINESCKINRLKKVYILTIATSEQSDINKETLLNHLMATNSDLFGKWTQINIYKENFKDETDIIHSIQGEEYSD